VRLVALVALLLVTALCGCSSDDEPSTREPTQEELASMQAEQASMDAAYEAEEERRRQQQEMKDDYIEDEEWKRDRLVPCDNPDWPPDVQARCDVEWQMVESRIHMAFTYDFFQPSGVAGCPPDRPIKGNVADDGDLIFHEPGWRYYDVTIPEDCFKSPAQAHRWGYRPSIIR
jgi:hypothetical protein